MFWTQGISIPSRFERKEYPYHPAKNRDSSTYVDIRMHSSDIRMFSSDIRQHTKYSSAYECRWYGYSFKFEKFIYKCKSDEEKTWVIRIIYSHIVIHFEATHGLKGQFGWSNLVFWAIVANFVIHFWQKMPNWSQLESGLPLWPAYPKLINSLPQRSKRNVVT